MNEADPVLDHSGSILLSPEKASNAADYDAGMAADAAPRVSTKPIELPIDLAEVSTEIPPVHRFWHLRRLW